MANSAALVRLRKELKSIQADENPLYKFIGLEQDSMFLWSLWIFGPPGTAFEGGAFRCLVRFPSSYPMDPPSWQFLTPIFHPNVYFDGKVCVSVLQQPAQAQRSNGFWMPTLDVPGVCQSVLSLLSSPNPLDPANAEAATLVGAAFCV
ncbi:hypothetical protein PTSG_05091 [Salpingoeca rosetta]|uniref:UBC core domain-containing protein n=1 Tax=Salpingoeca rosetta (strain ATCC 50818 / BSB-021) TaxID=946362 RepID=F2UAI0_SALR5|nr:uncharacterized protein PTSG_05091 [Salpingoeca rosetta]EGD73396.1 hypothetical protein PTSG_05091 [Salpingoeca rosetta]|eukprot:XP_004993678.1 hypothetical protein PTSG_05091 [Salpingoeca rosetta]